MDQKAILENDSLFSFLCCIRLIIHEKQQKYDFGFFGASCDYPLNLLVMLAELGAEGSLSDLLRQIASCKMADNSAATVNSPTAVMIFFPELIC